MTRARDPAGILFVLLLTGVVSCVMDAAEREYLAALRGEEQDMTREEQIERLDRAIELAPGRARYRETRAIYRIDLRDFERARTDLDSAIVLADRPYLRFLRGLVFCQSGRPADALADFDVAIAGQPENAQFYRGRSLALTAVGRPDDALADAGRLIALAPQQAESYYARGMALAALGRDRDAIADFDAALERRPELVYPLRARAEAWRRLGDEASAIADLEELSRKEAERGNCAPCLDPFRY